MLILRKCTKRTIVELMFYLSYFLIIFSYMTKEVYYIGELNNLLNVAAMVILATRLLFLKYRANQLLIYLVTLFLGLYTVINSGHVLFAVLFLTAINCVDMNPRDIVKYSCKIKVIILSFVLLMYILGFTGVNIVVRGNSLRYSLGFAHPNVVGQIIMSIILEYIYLKKMKLRFVEYVLIILTLVITDLFTDSRAAVVLITFSIIFVFVNNVTNVRLILSKTYHIISVSMISICFIFNFFITVYGVRLNNFIRVDNFFSGRLSHAHWLYLNNPITLFGNAIDTSNTIPQYVKNQSPYVHMLNLYVDNSYLVMFYAFGIIGTLCLLITITKMIYRANNNGDRVFTFIACIYLILGLTSGDTLRIVYNFTIMFVFSNFSYLKNDDIPEQKLVQAGVT